MVEGPEGACERGLGAEGRGGEGGGAGEELAGGGEEEEGWELRGRVLGEEGREAFIEEHGLWFWVEDGW